MVSGEEFRQLLAQGRILFEEADSPFLRFAPPGSYDSPLPSWREIEKQSTAGRLMIPGLDSGLDLNEERQLELLHDFAAYYAQLPFPSQPQPGFRYHYENGSFVYFDGIVLYSFLRHFRPQRIIEAGSGYSSALMLDCSDRFFQCAPELTFIEPYPLTLNKVLRDDDRHCQVLERPLQQVALETFDRLEANDILFVDSSHVLKFNSDVAYILFEIMPRLRPGVLIHFHDIFANFDYPLPWLRQGRAWNEGYALRAFLAYNRVFRILMFNDFLAARHWPLLEKTMPLATIQPAGSPFKNSGVSLWLQKQP
jgi:predicted O-methyltransferase YrrM